MEIASRCYLLSNQVTNYTRREILAINRIEGKYSLKDTARPTTLGARYQKKRRNKAQNDLVFLRVDMWLE
jgi:hypothetical protein